MANEVSVEITVEEKAALRALTRLSKGIDSTTKDATASVKKMDMAFASFAGNIAADFVGRGISFATSAIKDFISGAGAAAAQVEKLKTQFQILTGDQKIAADLFEQLTEFSASTPFQLNNIAEASAQLLSFGFAADSVKDRIQRIGDVAAGSNSDLKEVALVYSQVSASGKLTGERLLQLQERAIPIGPAIAKTMGIAETSVRDMVSKGKVSVEIFEEAFNSLSDSGGMFAGAITKQSKTVNGAISTMNDNFDIMEASLGKAFSPATIQTASELSGVMQDLTKVFSENGPAMAKVLTTLAEVLIITPSKFWANVIGGGGDAAANMSELNAEISQLEGQLKLISADYEKQKDNAFSKFIGSDQESLESMGDLMTKITELKAARDNLIKQDKKLNAIKSDEMRKFVGNGDGAPVAPVDLAPEPVAVDPKEDARVKKELAVMAELDAIRSESVLAEEERRLLLKEAQGLQVEGDLEQLRNIELAKIEIKANAEMEKAALIKDAKERRLAEDKIQAKLEMDLIKTQSAQEIAEEKKKQALKAQIQAMSIQTTRNFLSTGISLAKQGSSAQKALMSADALVATYAAATQALKAPPGPPWSFALAGSTVAMGLANVAKINSQSFATGGVVGGFTGASMGPDNTIAQVRTGEMILTGNEQKNLFQDIRTGGGSEKIDNLTDAIMNQPIIVQVDNKEIARAVRDAQRDGFKVSA